MNHDDRPPINDGSLDLPYADVAGGPLNVPADQLADKIAGGLIVAAAVVPVPWDNDTTRHYPGLVFTFRHADGTPGPRVMLVVEPYQLRDLAQVVNQAVNGATAAAAQANQ